MIELAQLRYQLENKFFQSAGIVLGAKTRTSEDEAEEARDRIEGHDEAWELVYLAPASLAASEGDLGPQPEIIVDQKQLNRLIELSGEKIILRII